MKAKREELRVKRELLGLVKAIVQMDERLKGVREALRNAKFKFAAEGLRDLKIGLRVIDDYNGGIDDGEPMVYRLLRKEWSLCFEEVLTFFECALVLAMRGWKTMRCF